MHLDHEYANADEDNMVDKRRHGSTSKVLGEKQAPHRCCALARPTRGKGFLFIVMLIMLVLMLARRNAVADADEFDDTE